MDGKRFLAMRSAQAVRARVAAADDDDALTGSEDRTLDRNSVALATSILLRQEIHGEVDSLELAAGNFQIARPFCPAGEQQRIELTAKIVNSHILSNVGVSDKPHPLGLHLTHTPVDEVLLHLEVGYSVTQQAADAIVLLEQAHIVTGPCELLRGGHTGWTGADHRDPPPGSEPRRLRKNPALVESSVDDGLFNLLDGDRRLVDPEDAGSLAG